MKHCTLCGEESDEGTMMQAGRGPKQYLCPTCGEKQAMTQTVCLILASILGGILMLMAFSG